MVGTGDGAGKLNAEKLVGVERVDATLPGVIGREEGGVEKDESESCRACNSGVSDGI
jgi:hypothetical protein